MVECYIGFSFKIESDNNVSLMFQYLQILILVAISVLFDLLLSFLMESYFQFLKMDVNKLQELLFLVPMYLSKRN